MNFVPAAGLIFRRLPRVPDWVKRVGEAAACAFASGLIAWGLEEAKDRVKKRREAQQQEATVDPPGPAAASTDDTDTTDDEKENPTP